MVITATIGMFLMVLIIALIRSPKLNEQQLDEDAEEAEEEGLLATTNRRQRGIGGQANRLPANTAGSTGRFTRNHGSRT